MPPKATTNPPTKKGRTHQINPNRTNKVHIQLLQFDTVAIYFASPINNLKTPKLVKRINLVGLHHYHNKKRRQSRLRRQLDGLTNHGHTFDNMSRREINDFLNRLQEIQENRRLIKWRPEGPPEQKKFVCALRNGKFNHCEENRIATEKLLLQWPPHPLVVMAEKIHRRLEGKGIYATLQGWEYSSDEIEYRQDTETEDEPQSEPDNAPTKTHRKKKRPRSAATAVKEVGNASQHLIRHILWRGIRKNQAESPWL